MTLSSPPVPTTHPERASWRPTIARLPVVVALLALVWCSLVAYVVFPDALGPAHAAALIPSIPAALVLYGLGIVSWRESAIARIGLTLVMFWILMAVAAPYLPLVDPNRPIAPFTPPFTAKAGHFFWLGADMRGRDMLSRTLWGGQRVIVWGITATACAYVVGVAFGLMAGYLRGWWDEILSFIANILLSFPVMVLLILVLNFLGQSGFSIILAVTFSSAPGIMRIVRGLALVESTRDYIQAAQTRGESAPWIMVVEILPNVRGPLIVDACLRLGYTTVAITTLTFLGLGLQPPDPDWGLMIKEAASSALLWKFAYMMIVPSVAVSSLILGFNLMADGLREMSLRD
ncbi:ABC transporter permease [Ancylobacter amanitiformis]|uniref:Peptide/nickel transport system permease protein n=1 Tax=Ancylobacter amanitiformis TaxID=217069 RepID=A0ABU0LUB0_9HYPH|nr:ABC transporter permease [Ancylobacter amanitiformis]MDQ0512264.1 peptide/nickel transport system permease protein [Ancylobacter amanitiformis]